MFLRKKIIKGHSYYYLVRNIRVNGKTRQKVVRYIGRIGGASLGEIGFLRKKRVKSNSYYYLVRNSRVNGKTRQKVVKYIGRVEKLIKIKEDGI